MSLLVTGIIIALVIVALALPFCRGIGRKSKASPFGRASSASAHSKEKLLNATLENTLENRVAREVTQELIKINKYRGESKANYSMILNGDITKVSQLYNQLQICQGIGDKFIPDAVIDKMLNIAVGDHSTNSTEVLFIFEYLHERILPKHIRYLKQLFIRYGSNNNLFDVELYKIVLACANCQERDDFLTLIQSVSFFTPDLISLKLESDANQANKAQRAPAMAKAE